MYYLLLDRTQSGPFTLAQLIEMWQLRKITALSLYWEEGNADWLPLHNIAPLLEPPTKASAAPSGFPASLAPSLPIGANPAMGPSPVSSTKDEDTLYNEHPSIWNWTGSLFWGVLLIPILVGILILIYVFWTRATTRYRVTRLRVAVETGIFTRHSRELRIQDIRSIGARANMFGIGDVEFSTAARADAEVTFWGISEVERVRDMVKQLQNSQG